jgi:putative ATPase
MTLFEKAEKENLKRIQPLAARMRPRNLSEFVGQQHLLGSGQLLRRLIEADRIGSAIFFGPPGTGKTTLARLLATETRRKFVQLSAILHGVKDLREVLEQARNDVAVGNGSTLLFVDEIHRFNRTQQDALLDDVENGVVALIGATTANPFFAVNGALLSRSQVFAFEPLSFEDITTLVNRALTDPDVGLGNLRLSIASDAIRALADLSDGDARRVLSVLEIAALSAHGSCREISAQAIRESAAQRSYQYDVTGDEHYDSASALIKSIRGSDPDAGLYWLARMLEGGEDVRFLCRRLVILASEDIGNADPQALPLAVSCFTACEQIGLPESKYMLAQTVTYLACCPKSNASTIAIGLALDDVRNRRVLPVPKHLRGTGYAGAKQLHHGEGYQYSHNEADGIAAQDYLGVDRQYYQPVDRGFEVELAERLKKIREKLSLGRLPSAIEQPE